MTKKIIQTCDFIMEIGWLLALVSIPIYFNIYTSRVFEPDKISLFRSLVLVMVVAWAAKGLAMLAVEPESRAAGARRGRAGETAELIYPPDGEVIGPDSRPFPQNFFRRPLIPFALALAFIYIIATIFSVAPGVSWWGSYQRLQGTYTFLSYLAFFLVMAFNMRERRQVERLISFVLLANIPVALYGIMQHFKADPLPWQGDVIFRVTSTMGNAIFISAYLIMVLPLALYRASVTGNWLLKNRAQAGKFFRGRQRDTALSWAALYGCFMLFLVGLFFLVLNFNANYRPESSASVSSAAPLPGSPAAESNSLIGNESIGPWWALPLSILVSFGIFFLFTVRRRGTDSNYLFRLVEFSGYLVLMVMIALTIFFSQSRGPEAGIILGLFVFFPIIFWRRKAWKWLTGWLGIGLLVGGLLVLFNLPAGSTPLEPVFKIARQNPQVARLGQFFETNDGTGKVRQLIWTTVLDAVGDAAKNEPARLAVGYGPETLYTVSPKFYQPELGQIEARNAIPDRSHNGYLDALVNTGIIGLVAYIALVLAFLFYAFKFLRRTERFEYQLLLAALISIMLAHQVEIQTGIQIVSTWMLFFTCAALLLVLGGLIYGRWDAIGQKVSVAEPEAAPLEAVATVSEEPELALAGKGAKKGSASKSKSASRGRDREQTRGAGASRSGLPGGRRNGPVYANATTGPDYSGYERPVRIWYWGGVTTLAVIAFLYGWFGNIMPIVADTVYKQGYNLASAKQWDRATPYLQQAVTYAPNEDFYALYLGQAYLELAQEANTAGAKDKTKQANVPVYLKASEAQLMRANQISPLNPDHYANLARLYSRWAELEPQRGTEMVQRAIAEYKKVVDNYAPNNARLWAELAAAQATLATNRVAPSGTGKDVDKTIIEQAIASGEHSVQLDGKFDFNRLILGDIYGFAGRKEDAAAQYLALGEISPTTLSADERFASRVQVLAQSQQISQEQIAQAYNPDKFPQSDTNSRGFDYLLQGMVSFYRNNLDTAGSALTNATKIVPTDPYSHAYLSLVYKRKGQQGLAQSEAAQARDLAGKVPQNTQAIQGAIEQLLAS
ncbi:MAG TPA: O-antigen ligase family protein [Chloroflexia bacterium]|nr:O-antigen ligase family protein [Chloroflexia bacterium]